MKRSAPSSNTILGETWVESGEAPDWQRLYDRRERWPAGTVPAGGLFLTAGADIQKDRIEVDVWAWGRGLESWLIDHIVIEGGPERAEPWAALDRLLSQVWPHEGRRRAGAWRSSPSIPVTSPPPSMAGRGAPGWRSSNSSESQASQGPPARAKRPAAPRRRTVTMPEGPSPRSCARIAASDGRLSSREAGAGQS